MDPRSLAPAAPGRRARFPRERHDVGADRADTDDEGPAADRLLRPYFGMHRSNGPANPGSRPGLGYGGWRAGTRRRVRGHGPGSRCRRGGGPSAPSTSWSQSRHTTLQPSSCSSKKTNNGGIHSLSHISPRRRRSLPRCASFPRSLRMEPGRRRVIVTLIRHLQAGLGRHDRGLRPGRKLLADPRLGPAPNSKKAPRG